MQTQALVLEFLSCLSGSDAGGPSLVRRRAFLSCLSGSDGVRNEYQGFFIFLSCLSGSDADQLLDWQYQTVSELPVRQ